MSVYSVGVDAQALVADVGSFSTKVGYAGEDHPRGVYDSTTAVVRRRRHHRIGGTGTSGGGDGSNGGGGNDVDNTVGGSAKEKAASRYFQQGPRRDFLSRPIERAQGDDGDWECANPVDFGTGLMFSGPDRSGGGGGETSQSPSMNSNTQSQSSQEGYEPCFESHELFSSYLDNAFQNALGLYSTGRQTNAADETYDAPCNHPLMLLEKPYNPPALRQRTLEVLFEQHQVPASFLLRDAVAACYATGRTTATVVDVGYNSTVVSPVFDGFVEQRGICRNVGVSGRSLEERVLESLDGHVVSAGRKRKDRMRRQNQRNYERVAAEKAEKLAAEKAAAISGSGGEAMPKRDGAGKFLKSANPAAGAIPEYLMPLYQVRRAPAYKVRKPPFHDLARLHLARECKEMGVGAAVAPYGYVSSAAAADGDGEEQQAQPTFMAGSKLHYALPDGTEIDVTPASRFDVAELAFGRDAHNESRRRDRTVRVQGELEELMKEMQEFVDDAGNDDEENKEGSGISTGASSSSATAAVPGVEGFSRTSYMGEKPSAKRGLRAPPPPGPSSNNHRRRHPSSENISRKLYAAILPHLATHAREHLTSAPPAQMVCDAAFRCDRDQQPALLGNVVLCGGGACVAPDQNSFVERLRDEIEGIVHAHTPGWRVKVLSPNTMGERAICSWLGGSILGSLGTFHDMWISKKEYEEVGPSIVNRKCP